MIIEHGVMDKTMNKLVTIVIPVYNAEPYIERCVDSVINQTYKNLEIILVDDASSDNCPEICDKYARKDLRIKVIHKNNEGAGRARNTGIDNATGEYIFFFDSDDYVEPNTVEKCVQIAQETAADVVVFGHDSVTPNGDLICEFLPAAPQKIFCGEEITQRFLPISLSPDPQSGEDWGIPLSLWNKMYSLELIRTCGWRFASERDVFSEDFYSITELYGYVHKLVVVEDIFYHYTVNPLSLSRTYRADRRYHKVKDFYDAMHMLGEKMDLESVLEQPINIITFGFVIGIMKQCVALDAPLKKRYREMRIIVRDQFLQELVRNTRYPAANLQKKLLYWSVKHKLVWLCFAFVVLKNKKNAL